MTTSEAIATTPTRPWWRDAVFYQVYVRSFSDSDGDGVGDLEGIRGRLPYLRDLGIDALWLTPFYVSPMADHGYDVADPRDVDPVFGYLADFDALVRDAHALGLKVTVDIVPNHSSDRHAWFQEALASAPGSLERSRYLFRDGVGPDGAEPPNNWRSVFGGPAWTRVPDGQWYLHMFTPEQPDLDWRSPDVGDDYERTLRFWMDRGADGFRIDVAHGLVKDAQLRDNPGVHDPLLFGHGPEDVYAWNQPEVHDIYRRWRRALDDYPGDRMAVGEIWVREDEDLARYVRPDELHLAFNFRLLRADWAAAEMRRVIDESTAALRAVGAPATWVLSNHDVVRHVTRYGGGELGTRRARAALLLLLALPGPAYLYAGEELGLPEVQLPDGALTDPIWERSGHTVRGRDGCRVPLPWCGTAPPYGFAPPGTDAWLPMPADWAGLTVQAQEADGASMLALYRQALALRHERPELGDGSLSWLPSDSAVLAFSRDGVSCVVNFGPAPVPLPAGRLLIASDPAGVEGTGQLGPDSAVWVARDGTPGPASG